MVHFIQMPIPTSQLGQITKHHGAYVKAKRVGAELAFG